MIKVLLTFLFGSLGDQGMACSALYRLPYLFFCGRRCYVSLQMIPLTLSTGFPTRLGLFGTFLRSSQLIAVMRKTVRLAHPDPDHYLRNPDLEKCIDCHSNRVTAAVALFNTDVSIDDIAFKLPWSPESAKHYLFNFSKAIGAATARVILGHFLL
jgi:hypothetical protein